MAVSVLCTACRVDDSGPGVTADGTDQANAAGPGNDAGNPGGGNEPDPADNPEKEAPVLSQDGNPANTLVNNYLDWMTGSLDGDRELADNMITWQLPHGGFYKNSRSVYEKPWDGESKRAVWLAADGTELGTIDNDATVTELMFLSDLYHRTGEVDYRDAARAAMEFLLNLQHTNGGFPQVYPERSGGGQYSNLITFNDHAMIRAMLLLDRAANAVSPLDGDLLTDGQRNRAAAALQAGVDYILAAQIVNNGQKTVWCAQHDPDTYEPRGARSYELASKSGKESSYIAAFLMSQPQTEEVEQAVKAALAWYRNPTVYEQDTRYVKRSPDSSDDDYNPIQAGEGSRMWYRFYEVESNVPFFSGRLTTDDPPGNGKQYDLMLIEPERRYGYEWGGNYGVMLLRYAESVGY